MNNPISVEHKLLLEEIKRNLSTAGSKESNFIKVELLFYDAISVARHYGDNEADNRFLAAFKQLQANQYRETKELFNKSTQRERVIRRFISSLKSVITAGIKNAFWQPQMPLSQ